jgi:hypothetical protein
MLERSIAPNVLSFFYLFIYLFIYSFTSKKTCPGVARGCYKNAIMDNLNIAYIIKEFYIEN